MSQDGQRNRPPAGRALRVGLERGLAAHLDDGPDHPQLSAIDIERIDTEACGFAPAKPGPGRGCDERPVASGHGREESRPQVLAADHLFVGVALAPPWEPHALARVERDEPVPHRGPEYRRVSRWHSATVAGDRRSPSAVTHS